MKKLRSMERGMLLMFSQPLNGRTGVEQSLSDAKICESALGHPTTLNAEWMKDMGKDSQLLSKRRFLEDALCKQRSLLARGIRRDSENESKPIGWRESEMKDGITQRWRIFISLFTSKRSPSGKLSKSKDIAQGTCVWPRMTAGDAHNRSLNICPPRRPRPSAWEKWAPTKWDPAGLGILGFRVKILAWRVLHVISPLGGIFIVKGPVL